jgi:hypothetical protein
MQEFKLEYPNSKATNILWAMTVVLSLLLPPPFFLSISPCFAKLSPCEFPFCETSQNAFCHGVQVPVICMEIGKMC